MYINSLISLGAKNIHNHLRIYESMFFCFFIPSVGEDPQMQREAQVVKCQGRKRFAILDPAEKPLKHSCRHMQDL